MFANAPFSTYPFGSSETLTSNGQTTSLDLSIDVQKILSLTIEHAIFEVTLNIDSKKDFVLEV
jgi:hypothetical protein